jgi:hypothetical protein
MLIVQLQAASCRQRQVRFVLGSGHAVHPLVLSVLLLLLLLLLLLCVCRLARSTSSLPPGRRSRCLQTNPPCQWLIGIEVAICQLDELRS